MTKLICPVVVATALSLAACAVGPEFQQPKMALPAQYAHQASSDPFAGTVGLGVTQMKAGTRVAWINRVGSYAEQIVLPVEQAVLVPNSFGISESMLLQGVTAQYLLAEYRDIRPGDVVLVHSAAGGVGQILARWLRHLGAIVIATASSARKLETARSLGADHTVNYSNGFLEGVFEITRGRGVDLALDAVGAATFSDSVKALARRGTAVSYGGASGIALDVEVRIQFGVGRDSQGDLLFDPP